MKLPLLLMTVALLMACAPSAKVESKLNELEKRVSDLNDSLSVGKQHEEDRLANLYSLSDSARQNYNFAWLYSTRPISAGEVVRLGDDVWRVEAVIVRTGEGMTSAPKQSGAKVYHVRYVELGVTFYTKGQTAPGTNPPPGSP